MSEKNKRLGRGLSALLGEKEGLSILNGGGASGKMLDIDLDLIDRNPKQPRKKFNEQQLAELSESIRQHGLLEPVILRKKDDGRYEIIAGERRVLASRMIKLRTIPSIVRVSEDEKNNFILSVVENIQRADLNCIEEANAYNTLHSEYKISMDDIAVALGKSRPQVNNLIRLLTLPENVQKYLADGKIDMGHARALVNCPNAGEIADYIADNNLSVRDVEKLIRAEKIGKKFIPTGEKEDKKTDFRDLESKFGRGCKISYQKKLKKYRLLLDFDNYENLKTFVNGQKN
ncbi:MAG: ParB/RepB/Spo0J family partition protein [Rickettsiales bacterium]|jgi:ParB family chromosome partitioning protein|nr:ParB/RepB/Spo0J family partition protein [Rickettsiales bacterium]